MFRRLIRAAALLALAAGLLAPPAASAEVSDGWDHRSVPVGGSYQVLLGQFGGDEAADLLFYAPGAGPDSLWIGHAGQRGAAAFTKVAMAISGSYKPIVADLGGDDYDDVLWYAAGAAADPLWVSSEGGTGFTTARTLDLVDLGTPYVLADNTAAGRKDDILWYGAAGDRLFHFADGPDAAYESRPISINGWYRPVVGDWNGDGLDDLFFHAPGAAADYRWAFLGDGRYVSSRWTVNGDYRPVVSYGETGDSILFWGDGARPEGFLRTTGSRFEAEAVPSIDLAGATVPYALDAVAVVAPFDADAYVHTGADGVDYFYLDGEAHDAGPGIRAVPGDFDDDGWADLFLYGPGSLPDEVRYGVPDAPQKAGPEAGPSGRWP